MRNDRLIAVTTFTADGSTDTYGNPTYSAGSTREFRGWFTQTGSSEDSINRETAKATFVVFLPAEADGYVDNTSTVTFDDENHRVLGVPNVAYSPRGIHHIEVTVERIEG